MNNKKDSFSNFIVLSIALHVVIFILLTVKVLLFPSESPDYIQAVRIDVVALPEKHVTPPKPIAAKKLEPVKVKPKKKPAPPKVKPKPPIPKPKVISLKKKKKKVKDEQNSAIARLKALQKIKNKKEKAKIKPLEYKGNEVSKGNSLSGLKKLHHQSYLDDLDGHIKNFWNLPEWLASGNLKARVLLLISKDGSISGKSFIMKSGNDLFDQHIFSTLDKASPLPAPPANLIDFYSTKGVEIRFPE